MKTLIEAGQSRARGVFDAFSQTPFVRTLSRQLRRLIPEHQAPRVHGSIYSPLGKLLIESPQLAHVRQAEQADDTGRVRYFPSQIPANHRQDTSSNTLRTPDEALETYLLFNTIGIGSNLFSHDYVIPPLEQYLRQRYANRDSIGVRGTACALEDGVVVNGIKIVTAAEIVNQGIENGKDYAAMTGFNPKGNPTYDAQIGYRSVQWLMSHPQGLRKAAIDEGSNIATAGKIFPILLVYDRSKFPEGSTTLPTDPHERAQCILEALILDYPLPMSEADRDKRRRMWGTNL